MNDCVQMGNRIVDTLSDFLHCITGVKMKRAITLTYVFYYSFSPCCCFVFVFSIEVIICCFWEAVIMLCQLWIPGISLAVH